MGIKGAMKSNQRPDERLHIRKRVAGGTTGAVVGAVVAGPLGALVGGVVGAVVGRAAERGALPKLNPPNNASVRKIEVRSKVVAKKTASNAATKTKAEAASLKEKIGSRVKATGAKNSRRR